MTYNVAKKHLQNYPLGFRVEFVEFIDRFGVKTGSDTLCK